MYGVQASWLPLSTQLSTLPARPASRERTTAKRRGPRSAARSATRSTGWGAPYFSRQRARPRRGHARSRSPASAINLYELAQDLKARGLELPLLIRFSDIVGDRIKRINEAFGKAIAEYEYPGTYRGVFPVKVNQQRHLVEESSQFGRAWNFGLEAGSQAGAADRARRDAGRGRAHHLQRLQGPEVHRDGAPRAEVRQDRHHRARAPRGARHRARASEKLGIRPILGVRAKLTTQGRRALGGLGRRPRQVRPDHLRNRRGRRPARAKRSMLDCLQLLHFHIGSQISSIIPIKNAMQEAANIYVELAKMGCKHGLPRRGRRPRRRLRRLEDRLPRLEELPARRVRGRRRRPHPGSLHQGRACPSRPSSARAGAPSPRTTPCWCSRSSARSHVRFGEPDRAASRTRIAC